MRSELQLTFGAFVCRWDYRQFWKKANICNITMKKTLSWWQAVPANYNHPSSSSNLSINEFNTVYEVAIMLLSINYTGLQNFCRKWHRFLVAESEFEFRFLAVGSEFCTVASFAFFRVKIYIFKLFSKFIILKNLSFFKMK